MLMLCVWSIGAICLNQSRVRHSRKRQWYWSVKVEWCCWLFVFVVSLKMFQQMLLSVKYHWFLFDECCWWLPVLLMHGPLGEHPQWQMNSLTTPVVCIRCVLLHREHQIIHKKHNLSITANLAQKLGNCCSGCWAKLCWSNVSWLFLRTSFFSSNLHQSEGVSANTQLIAGCGFRSKETISAGTIEVHWEVVIAFGHCRLHHFVSSSQWSLATSHLLLLLNYSLFSWDDARTQTITLPRNWPICTNFRSSALTDTHRPTRRPLATNWCQSNATPTLPVFHLPLSFLPF